MQQTLKEKLAKIYALIERGATDGERTAAKTALDKILKKYNIEDIDLTKLDCEFYYFKYSTQLDEMLLIRLCKFFMTDKDVVADAVKYTGVSKKVRLNLNYPDYVVISSSYEYYRRHMKVQWDKTCLPEIKKKRKAKTINKRRQELQTAFFERYVIASKLVDAAELTQRDFSKLSDKELQKLLLLSNVEGGLYRTQVQTGHLIN